MVLPASTPTQTSHMCNPISASAILFGAVSLLPDNRYIVLGLASTSGILYIANGQRPSNKLAGVKNAIESVEESLRRAKEECMRSHLEVVDLGGSLFEAKLSASKVQTRMLDTPRVTTYKEVVQYLQYGWDIIQDIMKCAKEVEEIHTKTLRIIEAERQHQFSAGIQESREIIGGATTFSFARALKLTQILSYIRETSWLRISSYPQSTLRIHVSDLDLA
ncbi:hypothetical protein K438DRAFT_1792005 [Mycena galopus ATCC 62051]|nr:hypothetical protein K438DRAFT_1792005 [Mycena galopus ATCC 62051]